MAVRGEGGARRKVRQTPPTPDIILEEALSLADEVGWSAVRIRSVAARLDCSMAEIRGHYRDIDALANAWYARALDAMLVPVPDGFFESAMRERLHVLLMRWFDALAVRRRVSVDMLRGKLYGPHPHHWVPMVFNLSRLMHWVLDAAADRSTGRRRQVVEVGLTSIFLATLAYWMRDASPRQKRTRRFLLRRLSEAEALMERWPK